MTANNLNRRDFLKAGAMIGAGALIPGLAFAAEADLMPAERAFVDKWVGTGTDKFPGLVTMLGLPGKPTQYVVKGTEGFTDPDALNPDSLFRIYSMTKPITGMATMLLIGQGKLRLDQPVSDILPRFAHMQVQKTYDGSITDLKPATRPITIRNLITHTSGLGYSIIQRGPIKEAYEQAGLVPGLISRMKVPGLFRGVAVNSLETFADRLAEMPLVYDPGTTWSYSVGLDLMGRVIEVVSGKSFDTFLKHEIFDPCGMESTFFQVPKAEAHRLTTNYAAFNGMLAPIDKGEDSIFLDKPPFPFGGAGLVSSPRDYDRFLLMLAGYGAIDGKRVIPEDMVRQGTSNLLPPGVKGPAMMAEPSEFGAGGRVGIGVESGIYGWAGAAGTVGTVDMKRGIRSGIFVQFMPPTATNLLSEYQHAIRSDVVAMLELRK